MYNIYNNKPSDVHFRYEQKIPKKGAFVVSRFLLKSNIYGKRWQINLVYCLQIFIGLPITFSIDIVIELIKIIIKLFIIILKELKNLFTKLFFELFKSLLKPFAVLISISFFSVFLYSLFSKLSIYQVFELIINKIF